MAKLLAGFARVDVTPPLGMYMSGYYEPRIAQGILDPLYANALAVREDESTAIIVNLDIIGIQQSMLDEMRSKVAGVVGTPIENVFIACTHTHTGPVTTGDMFPGNPDYNARLHELVAQAAMLAVNDLTAAELRIGREQVPDITFIRRFRMKDGTTRTNPGRHNPDILCPLGEPDETMQLVRIIREGAPEILIVNFTVHPDVVGGGGAMGNNDNEVKYSADYPGFLRQALEGALGNARVMYFNGAEGDTNHVNVNAPEWDENGGYEHAQHMGRSIAAAALRAYTKARPVSSDGVKGAELTSYADANKGKPEQLPLARDYVKWHDEGRDDLIPEVGMGVTTLVAEAHRILALADAPDKIPLKLVAIRFGGVCIAGIPGEPFGDIGRGIKDGSPFEMQLVSCCANGYEGYFPMQSAYDEGGYEARSSSFKAGIAEQLVRDSLKNIDALK